MKFDEAMSEIIAAHNSIVGAKKKRIAALEEALREAIEYVLLDTEIPRSVRDWQNVLVPNAGLIAERQGNDNER